MEQAAYSMIRDWACGDRGAAVVRLGLGLSLTPVVSEVARIVTAFSPRLVQSVRAPVSSLSVRATPHT